MSFTDDFKWQSRYYPIVKRILRDNAIHIVRIEVADDDVDMKEATDFVVSVKGGTVAVRIRKDVANKYKDLTIRNSRPSGQKTELQKIKEGFGDYYLYMWTEANAVVDWILTDLNMVRIAGLLDQPRRVYRNYDGTTFIALARQELERIGALIARKSPA